MKSRPNNGCVSNRSLEIGAPDVTGSIFYLGHPFCRVLSHSTALTRPGLAERSGQDPTVRSGGVVASFVASDRVVIRANRTAVRIMQHASGLHMREIDAVVYDGTSSG